MPKRKLCWLCGITIGAIAVGVLALGVIVKHEPNFYRQSQIPEGEARKDLANTFMRNFGQMILCMKQETWDSDFTVRRSGFLWANPFCSVPWAELSACC